MSAATRPHTGRSSRSRLRRVVVGTLTAAAAAITPMLAVPVTAHAAGESVQVYLTTTNDSGGRNVVKGLEQQAPLSFASGTGGSGQNVTVDEGTTYQKFTGGGASFTDTAAWLMNSSGALSASTRNTVMQKLFDPVNGIGLGFLRNPMGASDLARGNYTYDDMPAGQTDPGLAHFSIAHDLADVVPLTKQARQLNPDVKVMGTPWTPPPWMKDNDAYSQGWLESQYYAAYAQYFVKYLQAYQAQGVPVDYVTVQNEPTCCSGYPSAQWNGSGLAYFTKTDLLPALHAAGLSTKVLALDWNWDTYDSYAAPTVTDSAVRNDPNFGGIAWHGYGGNVGEQTTVHNQYPTLPAFDTEHSGGTWIANQQKEDMENLIDYTRNWGQSWVKWSLAVDQNMGPHNGGCGTCTGLITVHNGDSRSGQVDYTIEYYTMGQLTKFVKPGATRIASTDNSTVRNVAWRNPDGSKALIAYNESSSAQTLRVNWGNENFSYSLPGGASATFTWSGTPGTGGGNTGGHTGTITGYGGKCVDVAGASSANGAAVQLYDCNGTAAQSWTASGSTFQALGKCMDVAAAGTANGTQVQLYDCNGTGSQVWTRGADNTLVNPQSGRCLDATGPSSANGTRLQIWDCTGAANQQWNAPAA
ncbi:ricin-type beta-trefoil lectin domain protein [Actinacidiphila bryophytorum]|uniref:Glucosylceramidase n=1 Tax=Actinacidiphila bryophytorum TaxID=1436133 RepID=A0A9W4H7L8_9ACTN|nr:ricin-type beta-trefoil lectin domain protein [Actinacidiphila bryophytorum]MBN6544797.1 ricin-type beta-trefoil lectin domain protein [Actinacidiphila bryophytorum]CAG7656171.1 Glucosylceramidase [Actinacidiphila bryophytorum]